jgi:hypothetical protein
MGALTGGLIGMLGGPVGAARGFTIGASDGLEHAIRDTLDGELVESVSARLSSGPLTRIRRCQR